MIEEEKCTTPIPSSEIFRRIYHLTVSMDLFLKVNFMNAMKKVMKMIGQKYFPFSTTQGKSRAEVIYTSQILKKIELFSNDKLMMALMTYPYDSFCSRTSYAAKP